MSWMSIGLVAMGVLALAGLAYWQLIVAEGAYLGSRAVAWTYDWVARRYDTIKQFDPRDESWFVAGPVLQGLQGMERPVLLDVATGTGRLPLALLHRHFAGRIVGLDLSRGMLTQAGAKLRPYGERVRLIWQDASRLPFDDNTFDAVTCLESLEFMPRPLAVLAEMVRILAPGGLLFLTNRVGRQARLLPGRAMSRPRFERVLAGFPLDGLEIRPWQVDYDLALAHKTGDRLREGRGCTEVDALLRCPACGRRLQRELARLGCGVCGRTYSIHQGIIHLAAPGEHLSP